MKRLWKSFAVTAALAGLLGGCAVYQPAPVYSQAPVYRTYPQQPAYVEAAPVYVQPAPVYAAPPVSFGFNFGYWGGGRGWHHR